MSGVPGYGLGCSEPDRRQAGWSHARQAVRTVSQEALFLDGRSYKSSLKFDQKVAETLTAGLTCVDDGRVEIAPQDRPQRCEIINQCAGLSSITGERH